ncbi:putative ABC transport system permease protein [Anaerocolumna jejuensis DSM 15929]|uniref:Putative ABC transport system permease protein n=1 Tax=Anaerocolumna jejuensis DSM 15929 TaxID=1121322 RepID=A0A1M6PTS0_9FIRM|nr:FtsX-like permease family protein [Anaerocolumna jejuensis]SHK11308.1 putative ABC transport system permease protein [Anaerocolumna jejuensis DSM 15929]
MKSVSFQKSARRAVKSTATRFISIALISFLGAGIFAGLAAVSPNMKRVGDEYYDKQNVMDIRMLSTYGFTEEDISAIRNTEGVLGVMASYTVDATGTAGDKDYAFRLNGLSNTKDPEAEDYINQLKLIDGKWPKNSNEAIIVRPSIGLKNITIGSTISLDSASNNSIPDTLGRTDYTISGIAETPYYLSFMQGNTSVGSGSVDYVLYVPESNFIIDSYTDLYVTIEGAKEKNAFEQEYFQQIDATADRLKVLAGQRETLRYEKFRSDLADARKEYAKKVKEVNGKLANAEEKLTDGRKTLADAKEQYAGSLAEYNTRKGEADKKLTDARIKLEGAAVQIAEGDRGLSAKQKELYSAEAQLKTAREKLDNGWREYYARETEFTDNKSLLSQNKKALDRAQAQYDAGVKAAESSTGMTLEQIEAALPSMKKQLEISQSQYDSLSQLAALKAARDAGAPDSKEYAEWNAKYQQALRGAGLTEQQAAQQIGQLDSLKMQLDTSRKQYENLLSLVSSKDNLAKKWEEYYGANTKLKKAGTELAAAKKKLSSEEAEYSAKTAELKRARVQLQSAESKLTAAKQSYQTGLLEYNKQKSEADTKLADGRKGLRDARSKIEDGEKKIAGSQQEYDDKKAEADGKLSDGKQEIEDASKKLSDLGEPKWYVLDRDMNESFVTYNDDAGRMHDLATVFPVIFFLVAALVCLTTMTRMVDEDRTLIGTFKALGYSNGKIAGRYLKYAASASIVGSIAGVLLGFWLLPTIIWNAYNIVFALPQLTPAFYTGIAFISIFATVFIITLSTGIAAKKILVESSAELMRPKAPKSGKRVLLEYVKPIWNNLSFTKKVTVRNLGLNKKRLVMTLIGIIGCTALVVTAFGAKNAVRTLLDKQFDGIFHYNVTVGFNEKAPSDELFSLLADKTYFEQSTIVLRKSAEAGLSDDDRNTSNVYIIAAKDAESFTNFVTLTNPESKNDIAFHQDSAIVTEKLSMNLNVGIGDTIKVKYLDDNKYHSVTITGITNNYAFNYVYLGSRAYEKVFGEAPDYNQFFAVAKDSHSKDEIKDYLTTASDTGIISFTDDLMGNIRTSINSVNNIIWILIIAAGLLAFVVLYNLTNINIGERQRELATLKVLGFYDKETYSYIFRETVVLSIIGCLLGLFGGIFLYRAVISTVEPDMILLTRELTWQGYMGAGILTLFFTWVVNQCMKPRIKNIDMLESLKSVD